MTLLQKKHIKRITLIIEFDNTREIYEALLKKFEKLKIDIQDIENCLTLNNKYK